MSPSQDSLTMSGETPLLSLRRAVKRYGATQVLRISKFDVFSGDRIEITGTNSSGKSTLVRILSGYGRLSEGTYQRSASLRQSPIGYLPQYGGLFPELTLLQNVSAISRLLGRKSEVNPYSEQVFSDLELYEFLDRKAASLSGGIQRLGALAAIVSARPCGLILDEPFAGLDSSKLDKVRDFLTADRYAFEFILLTGHEASAVFASGRRVHIEQGEIQSNKNEASVD